jgi:ATP-dependent DNA ligase
MKKNMMASGRWLIERGKRVRLVSRNLKELTPEFPEIAKALAKLPGGDFVLDGEIVAFDSKNISRFQLL